MSCNCVFHTSPLQYDKHGLENLYQGNVIWWVGYRQFCTHFRKLWIFIDVLRHIVHMYYEKEFRQMTKSYFFYTPLKCSQLLRLTSKKQILVLES